jgi:hypothetical protein
LNSLAKYMSPGIGMSKLDSSSSEEHLELRQYSASIQQMPEGNIAGPNSTRSDRIVRTTKIEQLVERPGTKLG